MTYSQLYQKYQTLPPDKQVEVDDFIDFLAAKQPGQDTTDRKKPTFGSARGLFHIIGDFDAPLDDFADYQ